MQVETERAVPQAKNGRTKDQHEKEGSCRIATKCPLGFCCCGRGSGQPLTKPPRLLAKGPKPIPNHEFALRRREEHVVMRLHKTTHLHNLL